MIKLKFLKSRDFFYSSCIWLFWY